MEIHYIDGAGNTLDLTPQTELNVFKKLPSKCLYLNIDNINFKLC